MTIIFFSIFSNFNSSLWIFVFFLFNWAQQNEKQIVTSKLSKDFLRKYYINSTNTRCFAMYLYHVAITLCRISLKILNGKRLKLHII